MADILLGTLRDIWRDNKDAAEAVESLLQTTGTDDVGALIESLEGKDFATQTTLAALKTAFDNEDFAQEATLANVFKTTDFTEERQINQTPTIGTQGNAWDNVATGANGNSNSIDTQYTSNVDIFGVVSGATEISIYLSQDNTNFYDSGIVIEITEAEDFAVIDLPIGARYIRLQSSNDITATTTIASKM